MVAVPRPPSEGGRKPRLKLGLESFCRATGASLPVGSRLVERRERVVLAQELGEEGNGEVDLAAAWAPDEALLDQRLAEDRDAAGVFGAVAGRDLACALGRVAERGHRDQVALLGVAGELEAGAEEAAPTRSWSRPVRSRPPTSQAGGGTRPRRLAGAQYGLPTAE